MSTWWQVPPAVRAGCHGRMMEDSFFGIWASFSCVKQLLSLLRVPHHKEQTLVLAAYSINRSSCRRHPVSVRL